MNSNETNKEKTSITCTVHNNINSWAQRLLCNPELIVDSEIAAKSRKRNLKKQQEGEFVTHMEEVGEKDEEIKQH